MAGVSKEAVTDYLLAFSTCVLGLLQVRLDDKYLSVHDNDTRAGHPTISVVLEAYGRFPTALICAIVEAVACIHFAFVHELQGSRKHILPVVRRRCEAILYAWCTRVIRWTFSLSEKISGTTGGAEVSRIAAPCTVVLRECRDDLRALFGNDCFEVFGTYLLTRLKHGSSNLTGRFGVFLDSVAHKAHRSTLLWMVYTPIAIWFSLVLCAFSVSLAFLAPYTLYASPVSPCTLEVSSHPGQPPVAECVAVQIAEASTPATYHDVYSADFGSNAFISTSTSMSIQSPAVHESPSMNLSALLAETDPCADMSALLNLEMKFVPEIYVTLADESAQISRLSERHFEFSRSYDDELKDISSPDTHAPSEDNILPPQEAPSIATTAAVADVVSDISMVEEAAEDSQVRIFPFCLTDELTHFILQAGNADVDSASSEVR